MDGNGRWATRQNKQRSEGHRYGVQNTKNIVRCAAEAGVETLSLYTFSRENRKRPLSEITALMRLLTESLYDGIDELHENGVRLKFIGDLSFFDQTLYQTMKRSEEKTKQCTNMSLNIAVNYSGRWDIATAMRQILVNHNELPKDDKALEDLITQNLAATNVDLLIRTGDECRMSNFFLWQVAYAEIYFSPSLWPSFSAQELQSILNWYSQRQRRFGLISEQIEVLSD